MSEKNGFSLIEIIIALALLTVLAAIAVKIYSNFVERSKRELVLYRVSMCAMAIQNNCKLKEIFSEDIPECSTNTNEWPQGASLTIEGSDCNSFTVVGEYKSYSYCCKYSNNNIECKEQGGCY